MNSVLDATNHKDIFPMGLHGISRIGCCCFKFNPNTKAPLLIWMIIDEDSAAYAGEPNQGHSGDYEEKDTEQLMAIYEKYPELAYTSVARNIPFSPGSSWWGFWGRPPYVNIEPWGVRQPSLEQYQEAFYEDIRRMGNVSGDIHFYIIIDNSGSMTTGTLGRAIYDFTDWLDTDYAAEDPRFISATVLSGAFPERWIKFVADQTQEYINTIYDPPPPPDP